MLTELIKTALYRTRKELKLTQVEFAKMCKVSRATYVNIEIGAREPTAKIVDTICARLQLDIIDFLQPTSSPECAMHDVVGQSGQLFCPEHEPKVRYDWQKGNCLICAKKLEAK